ncbi:inositol-trisphosphate 3-kinase homolog isoform X2 [Ornithodoros turicata]|uniref:inositol-trisphosphate 3-kinase homolog isoform X2 n=1 Tax=Ornithodoros turicata TaxID=34597 RepID=UPI0031387ED7
MALSSVNYSKLRMEQAEGFPPVTYSSMFLPYLFKAASAGDLKAKELTNILQEKRKNISNGAAKNSKKIPKRWKQIGRSVFGSKKSSDVSSNGLCVSTPSLDELNLENVEPQDLTLLQLLALNALDLTAPASDILLKNRSNSWVQLSGHEGAFAPAGPGTIWKKCTGDIREVQAYESLMKDNLSDMVPQFYRDIEYHGEHFIEMQDLLQNFHNPCIMDIKMGTRTFLESEVQNNKSRTDLYEKMVKVDPLAPTPEEQNAKAITKLRYMQFRENLSSSSTLGFRIEGFKAAGGEPMNDLKHVKTRDQVTAVMKKFLGNNPHVRKQLLERFKTLRQKIESSKFLMKHEVIGSSLLIIHDGWKAGVWMIDFAKTVPIPEGKSVSHRSSWVLGNHEDGYLTGLDNLISVVESCSSSS